MIVDRLRKKTRKIKKTTCWWSFQLQHFANCGEVRSEKTKLKDLWENFHFMMRWSRDVDGWRSVRHHSKYKHLQHHNHYSLSLRHFAIWSFSSSFVMHSRPAGAHPTFICENFHGSWDNVFMFSVLQNSQTVSLSFVLEIPCHSLARQVDWTVSETQFQKFSALFSEKRAHHRFVF